MHADIDVFSLVYKSEYFSLYIHSQCCSQGQGYFKVTKADGTQLLKGGHFQFQKKYKIHINPDFENQMSPRDIEW